MKHLAPSSRNHVADHYQDGRRQHSTACSHMQLWTVTGLWGCMCVKGPKSFCSKTLAACTMEASKPQRPHTEPFLQTLHPNRGALNPFFKLYIPREGPNPASPRLLASSRSSLTDKQGFIAKTLLSLLLFLLLLL